MQLMWTTEGYELWHRKRNEDIMTYVRISLKTIRRTSYEDLERTR